MFSGEFNDISKNTFWHKTPFVAASVKLKFSLNFFHLNYQVQKEKKKKITKDWNAVKKSKKFI